MTGSSTVEPISVRVAELFEDAGAEGIFVTVEGPGTGDGFRKFCAGEADVADASRPIAELEAADCASNGVDPVELPVAVDGIAVITSRDTPLDCVSFADLYAVLGPESSGFTTWQEAAELAAELGSETVLPQGELRISAPGPESGTYDSFVELVIEGIAETRVEEGHLDEADAGDLRPDYPSASDDNAILTTVQSSPGSIGFVGFAFATEASGSVKLLEVDGGGGCVAPTAGAVADGSYPIARTLFVYVSSGAVEATPEIGEFVDFYVSETGLVDAVTDAGYVPLEPDARDATRQLWSARA